MVSSSEECRRVLNYNKVQVTIKPREQLTGQVFGELAVNLIPVIAIGALLYIMLRSAQGQGNQALSFGQKAVRPAVVWQRTKDKVSFKNCGPRDTGRPRPSRICRRSSSS